MWYAFASEPWHADINVAISTPRTISVPPPRLFGVGAYALTVYQPQAISEEYMIDIRYLGIYNTMRAAYDRPVHFCV